LNAPLSGWVRPFTENVFGRFAKVGENRNRAAATKFYSFFRERVDVRNAGFLAGVFLPLVREAGEENADERIFACVHEPRRKSVMLHEK
jgi:hypothetical protein